MRAAPPNAVEPRAKAGMVRSKVASATRAKLTTRRRRTTTLEEFMFTFVRNSGHTVRLYTRAYAPFQNPCIRVADSG